MQCCFCVDSGFVSIFSAVEDCLSSFCIHPFSLSLSIYLSIYLSISLPFFLSLFPLSPSLCAFFCWFFICLSVFCPYASLFVWIYFHQHTHTHTHTQHNTTEHSLQNSQKKQPIPEMFNKHEPVVPGAAVGCASLAHDAALSGTRGLSPR